MSTDRTREARLVNQRVTDARIERLDIVLARLEREGLPIVKADVADKSGVSRAFLYQNPEAKERVDAAIARSAGTLAATEDRRVDESVRTWRERALNAESELKAARQTVVAERGQIATLLGRIRDLEDALPADAVQNLRTENATLKRNEQALRAEVQELSEQLVAARENNRFYSKRVATLEMDLLEAKQDG